MVVIIRCYICSQSLDLDEAVLIENSEDSSEGYFAHVGCHNAQVIAA